MNAYASPDLAENKQLPVGSGDPTGTKGYVEKVFWECKGLLLRFLEIQMLLYGKTTYTLRKTAPASWCTPEFQSF